MITKAKIEGIDSINYGLQQVDSFQNEGNLIMAATLLQKIRKALFSETAKNPNSIQHEKLLCRYEECRIRLTKAMAKDITDDLIEYIIYKTKKQK